MKKQNSSIKAHLLWSALILLSLLAVCAIPFALAQSRSRGTTKQSVAKPNAVPSINLQSIDGTVPAQPQLPNISQNDQSQLPTTSNTGAPAPLIPAPILPYPKAPQVVLYDQINNPAPTPGGVTSQDFFLRGDQMWKYDLDARPLFSPAIAAFFVLGLALCVARVWRVGQATAIAWLLVMTLPTALARSPREPHM